MYDLCLLSLCLNLSLSVRLFSSSPCSKYDVFLIQRRGKIFESLFPCEKRNDTRELHGLDARLGSTRDLNCHLTASIKRKSRDASHDIASFGFAWLEYGLHSRVILWAQASPFHNSSQQQPFFVHLAHQCLCFGPLYNQSHKIVKSH